MEGLPKKLIQWVDMHVHLRTWDFSAQWYIFPLTTALRMFLSQSSKCLFPSEGIQKVFIA